jgi:hypothetical protein
VPIIFTKPTGVKLIDDIVLYTNTNKQFVLQSSILVGASVFLTQKYLDKSSGDI